LQLIARNRGLSMEKIRSTEAGLYFGEKAIEIGLADGITILSEFKSINKDRSITMNEQTTTHLKEETDNLTNKIKNDSYRTEVLELIRLCNVSRMPEKIGEFIEQDVNAKEAQEILMSILAERTKKTEILIPIPITGQTDRQ
jgi:ClpP class serine protease